MSTFETKRSVRILDFDIENRPLSYWYADRPTAEITAIGYGWADQPKVVYTALLGRDDMRYAMMDFVEAYNEADMVTGHYIRKHDLRIVNGALIEMGLPPLESKLSSDTKLDLVTQGDLPATQEHLCEMFGIEPSKYHMSQIMWRESNRLTKKGLEYTQKRVSMDVLAHMKLRLRLLEDGLLGAPRVWSP